jgi:hypothetical protein
MIAAYLLALTLQNPFPLERERPWVYRWDAEVFNLEFAPGRVTYHVDFYGAQAISTSERGSKYVTTVLYFPERELLLVHLFLRVALNPLEPSLNCALQLEDGVWKGIGRMENAVSFVTRIKENKLSGESCSFELASAK